MQFRSINHNSQIDVIFHNKKEKEMKDTVFVWTLTDIIGLCILGICLVIAIIFGIFYAFASLIDKMKHIYNKRKQP